MEADILLWIQNHLRMEQLDPIMKGITFLGDYGWFWIVLGVVLIARKKTRLSGFAVELSLLFSLLVNNIILKNLVARVRPYEVIPSLDLIVKEAVDFSFPSGHSGASFAAATAIFCTMPQKYGVAALILAALIAFSRLYVGIHYPTDVMVGILDGILFGLLSAHFIKRWEKNRTKKDS